VLPTKIYGKLPGDPKADGSPNYVIPIANNGSPIFDPSGMNPTNAWINGVPVGVVQGSFSVHDWNKDNQPDLKIELNNLDVIHALTPGGQCPSGTSPKKQTVPATLVIGNDGAGYWGGTQQITLTNCQNLIP
jgi:hypothetical protein